MISSDSITAKTECWYCGGHGHPATCETSDGTKIICASKQLGNKPDIKRSSNGDNDRKLKRLEAKCVELTDQIASLTTELEQANRIHDNPTRSSFRRRPSSSFKHANSASEESEIYQDTSNDEGEQSEDHSDESASSAILTWPTLL